MEQDQLALLVKRSQQGDAEAFVAMMGSMRERLYRTALAYVRRPDGALQAIEDVSYSAWLHIRALKKPEFACTWVTRILINICAKQLRHEKRTIPVESLPDIPAKDNLDGSDLRDAVGRLPDELRMAVSLRYFGGMTVPETAGVLGLPEGTVKSRLRKALSILRLEMEV